MFLAEALALLKCFISFLFFPIRVPAGIMDRHGVSQLYSNVAIPPKSRCIRLLEIEAAVDGAGGLDILQPLAGRLKLANLDDNPSFVSLSYVWGKGTSSHYILCQPGNCLVNIPWNCFRGLQQVTRRFGKVSIWVDSICINQNDDEEKIHQIPLMRDIYSLATCVYVWLGDGNKASDRALRFLKRQARFGTRLPLAIVRAQSDDEYRDALRQYKRACWRDMICERAFATCHRLAKHSTDDPAFYSFSSFFFIVSMDEKGRLRCDPTQPVGVPMLDLPGVPLGARHDLPLRRRNNYMGGIGKRNLFPPRGQLLCEVKADQRGHF